MRSCFVLALSTLPNVALAADAMVFSRTYFDDHSAIYLSLLHKTPSVAADFDFDVDIGLSRIDSNGTVIFRDRQNHDAHVRCDPDPAVSIGGADYAVGLDASRSERWTDDLWRSICTTPTS